MHPKHLVPVEQWISDRKEALSVGDHAKASRPDLRRVAEKRRPDFLDIYDEAALKKSYDDHMRLTGREELLTDESLLLQKWEEAGVKGAAKFKQLVQYFNVLTAAAKEEEEGGEERNVLSEPAVGDGSLVRGLPSFQLCPAGLTGMDLFNHMIKKRMREGPLARDSLGHLGVDLSEEQKLVLAPSATDLRAGAILKMASKKNVGKKLGERLINALGERVNEGYIVNTPERLELLRANARVAKCIEDLRLKAKKNRAEAKRKKADETKEAREREARLAEEMEAEGVVPAKTQRGLLKFQCLKALLRKRGKRCPPGTKPSRDNLVALLLGNLESLEAEGDGSDEPDADLPPGGGDDSVDEDSSDSEDLQRAEELRRLEAQRKKAAAAAAKVRLYNYVFLYMCACNVYVIMHL